MKPRIFVLFALLIIVFAQSCIPSIHPLYTKDKIVYLDILEGVWTDEFGDVQVKKFQTTSGEEREITITLADDDGVMPEVWDFRKNEDNGYLLIHSDDKGRKAAFDVYIVKLGGDYYMDFFLTDLPEKDRTKSSDLTNMFDSKVNDLAAIHTLPVHTFAKLIIVNEEVKIKMFDPDFLEKLFKQRQIRIKHEQLDDGGYVLTAQPEELQKFVEKYGDHKEAFIHDLIALQKQS
ncbi:MAG: hypothetical protein AAFZ15_31595 [Bacteroidota bacterium]